MALTTSEEALVRQLIAQNAELLNLATNETTIISKLAATKKNLGQLSTASSISNTDIGFVRQGTADKSMPMSLLRSFVKPDQATEVSTGVVELATAAEILGGTAGTVPTAATLLTGLLGAGGTSAKDYIKIPYRDKTSGVRRDLIVNFGTTGTIIDDGSEIVTFATPFPNAILSAVATANWTAIDTNFFFVAISSVSTTQMTVNANANAGQSGIARWIAIGY